jgi:predicted DNA-binding WGR domain protein
MRKSDMVQAGGYEGLCGGQQVQPESETVTRLETESAGGSSPAWAKTSYGLRSLQANRAVRRRRTASIDIDFTEMNRWRWNDSKLSLDADSGKRDSLPMITQPYQLYVERTDMTKNMSRFYAMSIEPNLFGEACLTRRWGRIGAKGQKMIHHFEREQDAVVLFLDITRKKRNRGYRPLRPTSPDHGGRVNSSFGTIP